MGKGLHQTGSQGFWGQGFPGVRVELGDVRMQSRFYGVEPGVPLYKYQLYIRLVHLVVHPVA